MSLALLLGLLPACGSSTQPGVSVRLLAEPARLEPGVVFAGDAGTEVRLDQALWTNAGVEISACSGLGARLLGLVIPSAFAHGEAAPTRSAEPVLESAFGEGALELGMLAPPAGDYCGVSYLAGPADADAVGLADAPDMLGLALRVRGASRSAGGPWQAFELASSDEWEVAAELEFSLKHGGASATVQITRDPSLWWAGLDFSGGSAAQLATLLGNVKRSIRIAVE